MDRLAVLLQRFGLEARVFHSGPLCGITDFDASSYCGQLHLMQRGPVTVHHAGARPFTVDEPSLLFYPRPLAHRFVTDAVSGALLACANVGFRSGAADPIARSLPSFVQLPLADVAGAGPALELLFDEAFAARCGRQQVVDRLFEVVLILILRALIDRGSVSSGVLAGMAEPRLAKALVAIHTEPAAAWSLDSLAEVASLSRSQFAALFRERVGETPGEYLTRFRIALAQDLLLQGRALKHVALDVGYGSPAALSRAFSATVGCSPRRWLSTRAS